MLMLILLLSPNYFNGKTFLRIYLPRNNISSTIKSLMNKRCLICYPNQGNTQVV